MSSGHPMRVLSWDEWSRMTRALAPPMRDDVSVTDDGRCLDTKQKVIEFFAEFQAERDGH